MKAGLKPRMAKLPPAAYIAPMHIHDMAVVGAGPAGLATALAAVASGLDVIVLDAGDGTVPDDVRASFLSLPTLRFFKRLGVDVAAQPVTDILAGEARLGEAVGAGELHFPGADVGGTLGAVAENAAIHAALSHEVLSKAGGSQDLVFRRGHRVMAVETAADHALLLTANGAVAARVVAACDGRDSALRRLSGIGVERHDYAQSALSFTLAHAEPHNGVAHQIFFPGGPLALLPLSGNRSSVVWTDATAAARAAHALDEPALVAELRYRLGDALGELRIEGPRLLYPLQQIVAQRYHADRVALVGDAAHVLHPLAGQGFNLSLRDAAALVETVTEARGRGQDLAEGLPLYGRWRRGDVAGMALATDALNHAYRAPLGRLRRLVTGTLDRSPLKALIVAEAAGERPNLPAMMG